MLWEQIRSRLVLPSIRQTALRCYTGVHTKTGQKFRRTKKNNEPSICQNGAKAIRAAVFLPHPDDYNILTLLKPESSNQDASRIPKEYLKERMDFFKANQLWDLGRAELTDNVVRQLSPRSMGSVVSFLKELFLMDTMKEEDTMTIEHVLGRLNLLHVQGGPESIMRQLLNWTFQLRIILGFDLAKVIEDPALLNSSNHLLLACAASKFRQFDVRRSIFGTMTISQKFAILFSPKFVVHFISSIDRSEFIKLYLEPNNYPLETLKRSNFHNILALLLRKMEFQYEQISGVSFNPNNRMSSLELLETANELETYLQKVAANHGFLTDREMSGLQTVKHEIGKIKVSHPHHRSYVIDTLNVVYGQPTSNTKGLSSVISCLQSFTDARSDAVIFLVCRKHQRDSIQSIVRGKKNIYVFYAENLSKDDLATIYIALQWGLQSWIISNDHFNCEISDLSGKLRENLRRYLNFSILRHDSNTVEEPCIFERRSMIANGNNRIICVEDDEFVYPDKRKFMLYEVKLN